MDTFFGKEFPGPPFELFGQQHLVALTILALSILFLVWLRYQKNSRVKAAVAMGIAGILLVDEVLYHLWNLHIGEWTVQKMLPLQLCTVFVWLSPFLLWRKHYRIYEFAYFVGIGGALQAVLTPDIAEYSFPHFRFFQVFLSHSCIILAALYMTLVERFRPTLRSLGRVLVGLNLYMVLVFGINILLGSNYLYLMHKPETPSALDMMGPWPWYIVASEALAIFIFFLLYLPFGLYDVRQRWKPKIAKA